MKNDDSFDGQDTPLTSGKVNDSIDETEYGISLQASKKVNKNFTSLKNTITPYEEQADSNKQDSKRTQSVPKLKQEFEIAAKLVAMKQPSKMQVMKNILRNNQSKTSDFAAIDVKSKNKGFPNPLQRNQKIAPSSSATSLNNDQNVSILENPYQVNNAAPSAMAIKEHLSANKKRRNSENNGVENSIQSMSSSFRTNQSKNKLPPLDHLKKIVLGSQKNFQGNVQNPYSIGSQSQLSSSINPEGGSKQQLIDPNTSSQASLENRILADANEQALKKNEQLQLVDQNTTGSVQLTDAPEFIESKKIQQNEEPVIIRKSNPQKRAAVPRQESENWGLEETAGENRDGANTQLTSMQEHSTEMPIIQKSEPPQQPKQQFVYKPKGKVISQVKRPDPKPQAPMIYKSNAVTNQPPEESPKNEQQGKFKKKGGVRNRKVDISNGGNTGVVEDQSILNMTKPLTCQNLNAMFQDRQDVFEYPQEKGADWRYPSYIKFEVKKRLQNLEINQYNEQNVRKKNNYDQLINQHYEEDEHYQVANQMRKNQQEFIKKKQDENRIWGTKEGTEDENNWKTWAFWSSIFLGEISSLISLVSMTCSLIYLIHFNFAHSIVRLCYIFFVFMQLVTVIVSNVVINNNLANMVLKEQHKNPENAEFLDFEDDDGDIIRKAKILAVQRRMSLQKFGMGPVFIAGFFKLLSEKDFPMQIYCGYVIEMCTLSLPVLILQGINNAMLNKWNMGQLICLSFLALNLLIDVRGIININDKMTLENSEMQRRQQLRRMQIQKQRQLQQKMGIQPDYGDEIDEYDNAYEDAWKSTSFSTQRIYKQTVWISSLAGICMLFCIITASMPFFAEDCGVGYYTEDRVITESDGPNIFGFVDNNICGKCEQDNCENCQISQGKKCDQCSPGYYKLQDSQKGCKNCTEEACRECQDSRICLKCKPGYYLEERKDLDMNIYTTCIECPYDGCETCADNVCKTCQKGYFLSDGKCLACKAQMDGCEECDNMFTCKKCNDIGFLLDPETNRCACNGDQGFQWNREKYECECRKNSFNIMLTDGQKDDYKFRKQCASCSEVFRFCKQCETTNLKSIGSLDFIDRESKKTPLSSLYIKCAECSNGRFYDTIQMKCESCSAKHGFACKYCNEDRCMSCKNGYHLSGGRCTSCAKKFENCQKCNAAKCLACKPGFELFIDICWDKLFDR